MPQQIELVSDLYKDYPNIVLLHGISKVDAESIIPQGIKFIDQINYSIDNSKSNKLSACSFTFQSDDIAKHLFSRIGLIIKEAEIINHFKCDSGLTKNTYNSTSHKSNSIDTVINLIRGTHNEFLLKNIEVAGIYIESRFGYSWDEIKEASENLNLKVYYFTKNGLLSTFWNDNENKYKAFNNNKYLMMHDLV